MKRISTAPRVGIAVAALAAALVIIDRPPAKWSTLSL